MSISRKEFSATMQVARWFSSDDGGGYVAISSRGDVLVVEAWRRSAYFSGVVPIEGERESVECVVSSVYAQTVVNELKKKSFESGECRIVVDPSSDRLEIWVDGEMVVNVPVVKHRDMMNSLQGWREAAEDSARGSLIVSPSSDFKSALKRVSKMKADCSKISIDGTRFVLRYGSVAVDVPIGGVVGGSFGAVVNPRTLWLMQLVCTGQDVELIDRGDVVFEVQSGALRGLFTKYGTMVDCLDAMCGPSVAAIPKSVLSEVADWAMQRAGSFVRMRGRDDGVVRFDVSNRHVSGWMECDASVSREFDVIVDRVDLAMAVEALESDTVTLLAADWMTPIGIMDRDGLCCWVMRRCPWDEDEWQAGDQIVLPERVEVGREIGHMAVTDVIPGQVCVLNDKLVMIVWKRGQVLRVQDIKEGGVLGEKRYLKVRDLKSGTVVRFGG